ncbi:exosome complex component RRP43 [Babesia ovis]|uniref:Exosome complex component RRP43 n=1 Tax=Babesia ovis TaxID=5869 RepID=A0A9W5T8E1_BABOV|nr:exosome complex component RRP43 [Babesia ovis]
MSSEPQPSSHASAFPSDVHRHIDPIGFYKKFLRQNVRPDGRKLRAFRTVTVSDLEVRSLPSTLQDGDGTVISSVRVILGDTHVHCVVKALPVFCEVSVPPTLGSAALVAVDIELPKQVQSYIYDAYGHSANFNFCISNLLSNVLNSDDVLPKSQLRFQEILKTSTSDAPDTVCRYLSQRNLTWKLDIAILCEEYDGNLLDPSVMATSYALRKAVLPVVLLEHSAASGSYSLRLLDNTTLENAKRQDAQTLKLLHANRQSIERQLGIKLNVENMASQLLTSMGTAGYIGRHLTYSSLPFTVTFLRFSEDMFLVDPTSEEERLGTTVSVYCLHGSDGSFRTQPLNLTCCPNFTSDIYECLKQVAIDVIGCITNSDI